jgi:hypothetical protein
MKRILIAAIALGMAMSSFAQTDSTTSEKSDTIRIGGIIIVKKEGKDNNKNKDVVISNRRSRNNSNVSTNWFIVDLGFANYNDKSNYVEAAYNGFVASGIGEDQLELQTAKSINVNIWFFMQRLNVIKRVVNLKYGLGLELNNYRFDDKRVRFHENPTSITLDEDYKSLKKNKLAADYITVPMMVNFNFTPNRSKGFGFSAGVSAGYLYSSRQKIKTSDGDKTKLKDDFDLRKWKLSYIGELNLGPVKLYGSYAMKSMWEKALDQTPYNVGIRLGNW